MANQENSSIRPLPKRVLAIRNDECALPMNLYMKKYISADDETNLAKDLLIHNMYEPVIIMIKRGVLYAYMGFRSTFSFVVFFGSLYSNLTTPIGRAALKTWFLQAIQQREHLHYNHHATDTKRRDSLFAMINGILNDRLVDKADCVTYFASPTLEALNIIPCKASFDRRCERLDLAPMNQQNKEAVCETYNQNLVNKVIHHYILNTLEMDNTKYGYAILSLTKTDEYDKLFRSYLVGDDKVDAIVIVDIILDLFMDEVQHNYAFWIEMVKKSKAMDMTRLSSAADNNESRSSSDTTTLADKESLDDTNDTNESILADLFALKLNDPSTHSNTLLPTGLHYTLALVIKDGLLDLDTLLSHPHQDNSWTTPLVIAMFSIGDHTNALWVLQNSGMAVSGALCDWLQRMMVARITAWFKEQTPIKPNKATTTTKKTVSERKSKSSRRTRNQKRHPSPLSQVTLPRDGYYLDSDTDDEIGGNDDYDNQHVDLSAIISPARTEESFASTTTLVNCIPDHGNMGDDSNDNIQGFDYFSPEFFYQHSTTLSKALDLLRDLLVPCMVSIGGTRMAAAPNTMHNIILLIHQALLHYHQPHDRPYLAQLFTSYIFPVLAYTALDDLYDCLQLLTTGERLGVYLRWRDDHSDDALRAYRDQAMADVQDALDSISSAPSSVHDNNINALGSLTQHHPIDAAQVILDQLEKTTTDHSDDDALVMAVMADLVCDDNQPLLRDGLLALLAHRLNTFKFSDHPTTENRSSLPAPVASLCRFSRYLFNDRQLPSSTTLFRYLNAPQSSKPGYLTARFIDYVCGSYPDADQKQQKQAPVVAKKRSATVLGTSYLTNKKSCR